MENNSLLDKKIIKNNFARGSANYDALAVMQKNAAGKLVGLARNFISDKQNILDLGSGTGFVAQEILKINERPKIIETDLSSEMLAKWQRPANVSALVCDIENLPFNDEKFDIIFSSFALHWLNDFEKSFKNFANLLAAGGIIAICLPCASSLDELAVNNIFQINKFPQISAIKNLLEKNNLQKIYQEKEIFVEEFSNIIFAAKYIKKIGGNYNLQKNNPSAHKLAQLRSFYLKNSSNDNRKFQLSWHNAFFLYQKII
jgi:malonyl-CoA O-methyltransferase